MRRGSSRAEMTSSIAPPAEPEFNALAPPRPAARSGNPVLHRLLCSRPNLFTAPLCVTHTAKISSPGAVSSSSRGGQTQARTASVWQLPRNRCQLRCRWAMNLRGGSLPVSPSYYSGRFKESAFKSFFTYSYYDILSLLNQASVTLY